MTRLYRRRGLSVSVAYPGVLGPTFPEPPPGFVYLTDDNGAYLVDDAGNYLIGEVYG